MNGMLENLPILEEFASDAQIEAASKVSRPPKLHVPRVHVAPSDVDKQEIEAEKRRRDAEQRARAKLKREAKKAAQDQTEAHLGNMLVGMAALEDGIPAIRFLAKLMGAEFRDGDQIDAEEVLNINPATSMRLQNLAATFGFTYSEGYFWCDLSNAQATSNLPGARARIALILNLILSDYDGSERNGEQEVLRNSDSEEDMSDEHLEGRLNDTEGKGTRKRTRIVSNDDKPCKQSSRRHTAAQETPETTSKARRRTPAEDTALHDSLRVFVQALSRVQKVAEDGDDEPSSDEST